MDGERKPVYHEKQRLQYCLLHSLNNLFQDKDAFTRDDLNTIAERISIEGTNLRPLSAIFKPHHNSVTGNYDANVLVAALEERGKSLKWHDRRREAYSIDIDRDGVFGIIINAPARSCFGLMRDRHWIALRRIEGTWYNLDSDLSAPNTFRDSAGVKGFLDDVREIGGEILLVMDGGV